MKTIFIVLLSIALLSGTSKPELEDVWELGPPVTTQDEHNVTCGGNTGCICDDGWCRREYILRVNAPLGWYLVGEPQLELVSGEIAAFQWNNFADAGRFVVIKSDNAEKVAKIRAGSKSLVLRIKCLRRKE